MKVKSTLNGNIKITMSPEQAKDLYEILNHSHALKQLCRMRRDAEPTSNSLFDELRSVGISAD